MEKQMTRMTLRKYAMYTGEKMCGGVVVPAPTNIRDGYEEGSHHRIPSIYGGAPKGKVKFGTQVKEGTDNTPSPREDMGYQEWREYYTHDVEKICDVEDTPELREWVKGCEKYGFPTIYYG